MKLHITYNLENLDQALGIAEQTAQYADIVGVGSLLLFKEGVKSVKSFKAAFPDKEIFAETRITEKGDSIVGMMAQAGAQYVSILAGTFNSSIKKTVAAAKNYDVKIVLDLLDAQSIGQSAMDAKALGVNMLLLNRYHDEHKNEDIESNWHNARENTSLPILISGGIDLSVIDTIIALKPFGITIGGTITKADDPKKIAALVKMKMSL